MGIIRWGRRLFILGAIVFLLTAGMVAASGMWFKHHYPTERDYKETLDVVLVLGGGIEPDAILAFSTRRRVHGAVYLLKNGYTKRLVFSGGKLKPRHPIIGEKMKEFAIELGADPTALDVEGKSRTTWENLSFSYPMLDSPDIQRIGLLTDPTHLLRASILNTFLDGPAMELIAAPAQFKTSRPTRVLEVSREALAWWYNLGKIVAWKVTGWLGYTEEERGKLIY